MPARAARVFTPNVDHVVNAETHAAFAAAYAGADLSSLADGMPLVWASRALARPLPERVAGSRSGRPPARARRPQRRWRVFFLGAAPGVAEKAAAMVRERYGTDVVGTSAPDGEPRRRRGAAERHRGAVGGGAARTWC